MQFEYIAAPEERKRGLALVIRHKATEVPFDTLPPDLRAFLQELPQ
jgi:hypothetical protein